MKHIWLVLAVCMLVVVPMGHADRPAKDNISTICLVVHQRYTDICNAPCPQSGSEWFTTTGLCYKPCGWGTIVKEFSTRAEAMDYIKSLNEEKANPLLYEVNAKLGFSLESSDEKVVEERTVRKHRWVEKEK